jgi:hypothetical protein
MSKVLVIAAVVLLAATPAYAYLDPGTGSIVLQALLAGLAVGTAAIAAFWTRIRQLFAGRKRSEPTATNEPSDRS